MNINKRKFLMMLGIPVSLLVISVGTSIGSANINFIDIISIIANKIFGINLVEGISSRDVAIVWNLRLPRVILAFMVGGALSASGVVVQSVLKNPLASPYTLGISSGASLGVGLFIVTGITIPLLGNFATPVIGFFFSLITILLVISFSSKVDKRLSNNTIILSGMVFSLFFSAILTTISSIYSNKMKEITMWQMGSFSMKGWSYVIGGFPFILFGLLILTIYTKEMDLMTFGDDEAKSMGVEVEKIKIILFITIAVLTGTSVALSGTIGFVDLIAPHIVRKIFGSKHIYVIPMSIVFGGSLMVLTDLIARIIIIPSELPVGAVTAIIGAPFFTYIYFKKSK